MINILIMVILNDNPIKKIEKEIKEFLKETMS